MMNYRCASDLPSGDALGRCRHSRSFTNFLIKGGGQLTFAKTKEYTIFCSTSKGGYENFYFFKQLSMCSLKAQLQIIRLYRILLFSTLQNFQNRLTVTKKTEDEINWFFSFRFEYFCLQ